jgi:acyl-coenzyme A thioesterase PaaI-like protein
VRLQGDRTTMMMMPPEPTVPAGCTPIEPFPVAGTSGMFVSRDPSGVRFRIRYFYRAHDAMLVAAVWFGPGTEGPPGHAHGGSIAAVLDEGMGAAAWHAGHPVVAARLTIDFRSMVALGTEATLEARVEHVDGRKVRVLGRLLGRYGGVLAEAHGLFIVPSEERRAQLTAQWASPLG